MRRLVLMAAIAALWNAAPAFASDDVHVSYANAYATSAAQKNGAVFLKITNDGNADDAIIGASSGVARVHELHTHIEEGNVMKMRAVPEIALPAGQAVTLYPMGDHIMLIDLTAPLEVGTSFPLTLQLKSGDSKEVTVSVVRPGSLASGGMEDCPIHGDSKKSETQSKPDAHSGH